MAKIHYFDSQPAKERAVAYCHCNAHKGDMSAKTMKKHGCLSKNGHECCPFLEKHEEHPYWKERAIKKEKKKERKLLAA